MLALWAVDCCLKKVLPVRVVVARKSASWPDHVSIRDTTAGKSSTKQPTRVSVHECLDLVVVLWLDHFQLERNSERRPLAIHDPTFKMLAVLAHLDVVDRSPSTREMNGPFESASSSDGPCAIATVTSANR